MGEVYLARDTTLDRNVALKILPDAFTADAERLARFQREAKVLAALNDWLTWDRPTLIQSHEHYRFMREQVQPIYQEAGLPEEWDSWGTGFIKTDRWLETLHTSLTTAS